MKFKFILVVLVILAVAAFATNPSRADVEAEIEARLLSEIDAFDPASQNDPVLQLISGACQLGRNACAGFIRSLMDVQYEDRILYSAITVTFGNDVAKSCVGVLTRVLCR